MFEIISSHSLLSLSQTWSCKKKKRKFIFTLFLIRSIFVDDNLEKKQIIIDLVFTDVNIDTSKGRVSKTIIYRKK